METVRTKQDQKDKDEAAPENPDHPRSQDEMHRIDGGYELMLNAFTPNVIEQDIGNIDLTNLNNAHGDYPDQNKGRHIRTKLQILD